MKKFLLSIFAVMLAVFSVQAQTKSFVRVTSAPDDWSGEYLIVYEAGNLAFDGSLTTLDAEGNKFTVSIANGKIDYSDELAKKTFTIAVKANASAWTVKSASGKFIGQTSNANGLKTATNYSNTLSINSDASVNIVSAGAYLRYNNAANNGTRFRYYKSSSYTSQQPIHLYKLTEETSAGDGGTTEPVETVANPVISPYGVTFNEGETLKVTIETTTEGADIYYTLDGTVPSADNGELYEGEIEITETTTVKAIAVKEGWNNSEVVSATYTKIEPKTIAEVIADGAVDQAMTSGTVVATYSRGFLLGDGTGYILVYQGASLTTEFSAGDVVVVSGPTNKYNGFLQFQTTADIEKTGTAEVVYPNVTTLDGEAMDAYLTAPSIQYVEYTGKLTIDGSYYNIAVDGAATALGSIQYPKTNFVVAESGDVVKVTGYTIGVSNSSGSPKYVNTMAVSVEVVEGGATDPEEPETPEIPEEPETPGSVTAPCYVKVTSAPADWSGKYLIVYEDGTDAYVFKALESAKNYVAATIDNGVILATEDLNAVAVEIASIQGGYSIETSEGYMYGTSGSNKLSFNGTTAQLNTIEYDSEDGVKITSNTSVFRFNSASDNLRFRYFKSASYTSQKSVQLYKYTEPAAETWSSFYAAFPVAIPEGVEAYIVTAANAGYVTLTQIYNAVPANTGVILKGGSIEATYDNYYSGEVTEVTGNLLKGTMTNTDISEEAYVLGKVDGVIGLYKAKMTDGVWLNNANKAYLPASVVPAAAQGAASFSFRFGEGTTAIENVEVENASNVIYDLTGRKVNEITAPGIYIVGGKKVLVK